MSHPIDVYYHPDYCIPEAGYDTLRKADWIAQSLTRRPIPGIQIQAPRPLSSDELLGAHTQPYLHAIRNGKPRWLAESQGFVWSERLWTAAATSNGGVVAAALSALRTQGCAGSLSCGLHHARADQGEGLCTFNGLALATGAAFAAGARRVLILDLDAHGGGGTWSLLSNDPRVESFDLCTYDFDRKSQSPRWHNVLVQDPTRYREEVERGLARLERRGAFDLCLYNAGMDPCGLSDQGLPGLKPAMLAWRERAVFDWCRTRKLPVAFVLAGGYLSPRLDRGGLVALHRETLMAAAGAGASQGADRALAPAGANTG